MIIFTQLNKEQAKERIKKLVEEFRLNYQSYRKGLEAEVETKLIEPLFEILGWTKKDFKKQEKAHRGGKSGHADYAFYIGDKIVFFLEVKRVEISLDKEADKQVISYALSKRVPFAVSTNFEELRIFCVEQENSIKNRFRVFQSPEAYISDFDNLFFLSKESFEQNLILKKAESEGRLKKRVSIDKALLEDLMYIRKLISNDIETRYHSKYQINEKDEIVQRIIDRLIFIRRCEDIGINPDDIKLEELRHLPHNKTYPKLKEIFKRYNDIYNSGLFAIAKDNDCDVINIDGAIIQKLAYYLYESKDNEYIYNFDWIDADVLGQVYEQYLGKILAQTKSGRAKLKEGQAHRKEQGIYYTPTYIVDYIVKNTVGELLKDKKIDASKIKILDPACGSGSFLIKAFDYLSEHLSSKEESKQHRIDSQGAYSVKTEILKNNIFGVDLDNKAVEITKLNLLLKAAEKGRKLPEEIDMHIRRGNSLIDDETVSDCAFKWAGDFQEGSFDIVIGNPPYVNIANIDNKIIRAYFQKYYECSDNKSDLYAFFTERVIKKLLKNEGYFGYIVSSTWTNLKSFMNMRKLLLNNFCIQSLVPLPNGTFPDANVEPIIFIVKKENSISKIKNHKIKIVNYVDNQFVVYKEIPQKVFLEDPNHIFNFDWNVESGKLLNKLSINSIPLKKYMEFMRGTKTSDNNKFILDSKKDNRCKPVLRGRDIQRYLIDNPHLFIWYVPEEMKKKIGSVPQNPKIYEVERKIIMQGRSGNKLIATIDNEKFYCIDTTYVGKILNLQNLNLNYFLALINSKLINYWYGIQFKTSTISGYELDQIPIKKIDTKNKDFYDNIIKKVEKILLLNDQLCKLGDKKTAQTAKLEDEIKKTDQEIDELVYKLYGITEEEKKIIEESLK